MSDRPTQQMVEAKKNFLQVYANTPIISASCKTVGISRETFYNWIKKDKEFAKKIEEINKKKCEVLEDMLYAYALKGNPTLLIFLACNWMPDKYKNIQKVDVNGQMITQIKIVPFKDKNDDKKEKEIEKTGFTETE